MEEIIVSCLEEAITRVYKYDYSLLQDGVSERCVCARLAHHLENIIQDEHNAPFFEDYFVDVEYNRMRNATPKMIMNSNSKIFPDLLIHSRGEKEPDNLLALEMKVHCRGGNGDSDKKRLKELVKYELGNDSTKYVCNTLIGVMLRLQKTQYKIQIFKHNISEDEKIIKVKNSRR